LTLAHACECARPMKPVPMMPTFSAFAMDGSLTKEFTTEIVAGGPVEYMA